MFFTSWYYYKFQEAILIYEIVISIKDGFSYGSFDNPADRFQSAVDCSKSSIESILYDFPVDIQVQGNIISITEKKANLFTEKELKEMLKPAFCDENGHTFPEFGGIKLQGI